MLVRFTKQAATARADTLACVRPDGTVTRMTLPRAGVLPRVALQFVIEATLGWRDGLFGQVARGQPLRRRTAAALRRPRTGDSRAILRSAALAECLQAEQWGGAAGADEFAAKLAAACRRRGVTPPALSAEDLARVRTARREFGAAWRPLNPGQGLERPF